MSIFSVLLNGCSTKQWQFNQPVENVEYIKIIRIIDIDDISDGKPYETVAHYNYRVLSTLEEEQYSELYRDIMNISFRGYGYSLCHPCEECFLICFKNGEFDLISTVEPEHIQYEDGSLTAYHSWLSADKEAFDDLIKKYYQDETDYLDYADSMNYLLLDRSDVRLIYRSNYSSGTLVSYEWLNGIVELGELFRINKNTLCNCVTDGEFYEFVFWGIQRDGTPGAFHGALLTDSFHDPSEFSNVVPGDKMEKVLQIDGTALLQVECCFSNQLESKHICKAGIVTIEWKKDRNGDYYVTKCSYKDDNDIRSLYDIVLKSDIPPR